MSAETDNLLGTYLKDRRSRLDPAAFGFPLTRRRTPGLRREEVANRANVSATWYTWLEQGRGGAPSANVLDRISRAMMLTDVEREHLYMLGLGRPPEVRYHAPEGISPRLQRLIDTLEFSPALVRTATWDVVAWNPAAALVLTDYATLPQGERNILRRIFCDPQVRAAQANWENVARYVVSSFRADAARAGAAKNVQALVDELCAASPEFEAMWRNNDVRAHGDGLKTLHHPAVGELSMEYSTFAVDGRPDLTLVVYNPATPADKAKIKSLTEAKASGPAGALTPRSRRRRRLEGPAVAAKQRANPSRR